MSRRRRARRRRDLHGGRPPRRKNRRWLVLLLAILLVGGACYAAYSVLAPMTKGLFSQSEAADFDGPGEGQVDVVVEPGQTGEDIATTLRDAGVVKSRGAYLEVAAADPKSAAGIQPGTYVLLKGMTAQSAFDTLADPANRAVNRTTVREGLWASETYAVLSKATGIPVKEYVKAAKDPKAIGLPKEADGKVEGWLAPVQLRVPREVDRHRSSSSRWSRRPWRSSTTRRRRGRGPPEGAHPRLAGRGRGQARRRPPQDRPGVPEPDRDRGRPSLRPDPVRRGRVVRRQAPLRCSRARPSRRREQPLQHPHPPGAAARPDQQPRARPRSRPPPTRPTAPGSSSSPSTRSPARPSTPRRLAEHQTPTSAELNAYCDAKPQDCGQ